MPELQPELADNADRLRWNARYEARFSGSFEPHPLAVAALSAGLPPGAVLDLASGPSGSALLAAEGGREVIAVDASDVALGLLGAEAARRGLSRRITLVHADLRVWRPATRSFSMVLCTGYWDADLFPSAADSVSAGGLVGWEAFTIDSLSERPSRSAAWCLLPGEPAALLPDAFEIISQVDLPGSGSGARRRMLARRIA